MASLPLLRLPLRRPGINRVSPVFGFFQATPEASVPDQPIAAPAFERPRVGLAHTLPTSHVEDPDLALIVGLWDRLADECKRRLIEMVRANMPRQCDADEFDEINERGN